MSLNELLKQQQIIDNKIKEIRKKEISENRKKANIKKAEQKRKELELNEQYVLKRKELNETCEKLHEEFKLLKNDFDIANNVYKSEELIVRAKFEDELRKINDKYDLVNKKKAVALKEREIDKTQCKLPCCDKHNNHREEFNKCPVCGFSWRNDCSNLDW